MAKKTKRRHRFQVQLESLFDCVVAERCMKEPALHYLLVDNPTSGQIPANISYLAQIEIVAAAASSPIPIESLSVELLEGGHLPRGNTASGQAATYIDRVASNCELRWWVTAKGLVMDRLEPPSNLSKFDAAAGRLWVEHSRNGHLGNESLITIAETLDKQLFSLQKQVQPRFWKEIAAYNQYFPGKAIKTFRQAVEFRAVGPRAVRKALYAARDRVLKSEKKTG